MHEMQYSWRGSCHYRKLLPASHLLWEICLENGDSAQVEGIGNDVFEVSFHIADISWLTWLQHSLYSVCKKPTEKTPQFKPFAKQQNQRVAPRASRWVRHCERARMRGDTVHPRVLTKFRHWDGFDGMIKWIVLKCYPAPNWRVLSKKFRTGLLKLPRIRSLSLRVQVLCNAGRGVVVLQCESTDGQLLTLQL